MKGRAASRDAQCGLLKQLDTPAALAKCVLAALAVGASAKGAAAHSKAKEVGRAGHGNVNLHQALRCRVRGTLLSVGMLAQKPGH